MTDADNEFGRLLATYRELGAGIAGSDGPDAALAAVTATAATAVPCDFASITRPTESGGFGSVGCTDAIAAGADALQYAIGNGPCVAAVENDHVFRSDDLSIDQRWDRYGPQVAARFGVHSVLSVRIGLDDETTAGLNLYACDRFAFDDRSGQIAMLLATHAAVILARAAAQSKVTNLQTALDSSREIGIAVGILMSNHRLTREDAFDLLRMASQRRNRKLRDIASGVADTGVLDVMA